jgi:hypothetical protein
MEQHALTMTFGMYLGSARYIPELYVMFHIIDPIAKHALYLFGFSAEDFF